MISRTCRHCKITKPIEEFYKNRLGDDGYRARCKECCSDNQRAREAKAVADALAKARTRKAHTKALAHVWVRIVFPRRVRA